MNEINSPNDQDGLQRIVDAFVDMSLPTGPDDEVKQRLLATLQREEKLQSEQSTHRKQGARTMRFGVMLIGPYEGEMDPAQVYRQSLLQARTAVANNFDALFVAQHYLSGPAAAMMQPLVLLANLAAEAQGLYLGTALYLLPLHHPVAVAEQTATLDIISGGKFLFGVGQGYRDQEFQSFGIRKRDRRRRMAEGIEVIRKLWSEDNVTFDGEFVQLEGVTIAPKPLQQPGKVMTQGICKDGIKIIHSFMCRDTQV